MAWDIDPQTSAISMHRGDTGAYWEEWTLDNGDDFVEGDVALYEVKSGSNVLIHREYELQPETPTDICPGDGKFLIAFRNSDTDTWSPGTYQTELRMVLNPIRSSGAVVDGDTVRTVVQSSLTIRSVLIDI